MEWWIIYLWLKMDMLVKSTSVIFWIGCAISFFSFLITLLAGETESFFEIIHGYKKYILSFLILIGFIAMTVPTSKEFAAIYLIPKITKNEEVKEVTNKTYKLMMKKLNELLEDKIENVIENKEDK